MVHLELERDKRIASIIQPKVAFGTKKESVSGIAPNGDCNVDFESSMLNNNLII